MILRALSALWASGSSPMGNHIWQSTLFAALAAILVFALRKNQARVRYWIWLTASLKFLVPFSLLVAIGGHLAKPRVSTPAQTLVYSAVENLSQPFNLQALPAIHQAPSLDRMGPLHLLPSIVLVFWLAGIVVVVATWVTSWIRILLTVRQAVSVSEGPEIDALRRMESSLGVGKPIKMVLSQNWMEPGIFGIFRPALIWPAGISGHLDDRHIEAILAHEVCHERRRDNSTAVLHMMVEAIFWFHPLVWWVGAKLAGERERACDEEVSLLYRQPQVYAESILRVCKFCSESPLACVSGITGADLKKRILQIMTERVVEKLDLQRKLLLLAVGLTIVGMPIALGQVKAAQTWSETRLVHPVDPMPAYEVAAIKPWNGKGFGTPLRLYIQHAFGIMPTSAQRLIGPDWIDKKSWVVVGKPPDALQEAMQKMKNDDRLMVYRQLEQSLLAYRFKLKVHFETREMPIFELVQAKGGAKLKVREAFNPTGGQSLGPNGQLTNLKAFGAPMNAIVQMLAVAPDFGGRPLVDKTGLMGFYDLDMDWLSSRMPPMGMPGTMRQPWVPGPPPPADVVGPSLSAALNEVGLKLVRSKGPVEVVVIDQIEEPTEN